VQHLNEILSSLEKYFPASEDIKCMQQNNWVKNLFLIKNKPEEFSMKEHEEFIELTTDSSLKTLFDEMSITDFWCSSSITDEYQLCVKELYKYFFRFRRHIFVKQGLHHMRQLKQNIATN